MPTRLADDVHTGSQACPSPEQLRLYLNGWSDDEQVEQLEQHLVDCPDCRQAMSDSKPPGDTLLQSLQSTVAHRPVSEPLAPDNHEQPIVDAIERVKQLVDKPTDAAAFRQAWQPAQREIGVYDLQKPLGRGGMGAVYLATHRQLRKQVAIKLLPMMSAEDSDVRARFDREIRVVGKLNHPSIVAATDAGEIDGTQFLVMEYVSGMDLSRLARVMGRLSIADVCELMRQAALGLSCAHAEGVVHRDVKPSNLMLDDAGRIRILDFGLAQLNVWDEVSIDLTTVGQLMGTLDYMAPEQAEVSGGVDYRADLYALGATLFRLLCGRPPLVAAPNQSPLEKLRLLANHQPPKLSTLCPDAPEQLVSLVSSLLARNPQDRPASAAHVAEQLAPFAADAKLVELLQQATDKAAASPELLKRSTFADKSAFLSPSPASPSPNLASAGRTSTLRRWLLAASLPLLLIAGILIKLELDKGQLIIESEVADVRVSLLKDGQPVDGIQVSQGTTSTRLKADKYEITIDGPTDGLVIDKETFTLKHGETVVARIRREEATVEQAPNRPDANSATALNTTPEGDALSALMLIRQVNDLEAELQTSQQTLGPTHPTLTRIKDELQLRREQLEQVQARQRSNVANSTGPLYEGQPLEHWLDVLSRENSWLSLNPAFSACEALATTDNGQRIADAVYRLLPRIDDTVVLRSYGNTSLSVRHAAHDVLYKALPGSAWGERWVKEFESSDDAMKTMLWKYWLPLSSSAGATTENLEPFIAWAERKLQTNAESQQSGDVDMHAVADRLRMLTVQTVWKHNYSDERCSTARAVANTKVGEAISGRITNLLLGSERLDDEWWLNYPLSAQYNNFRYQLWSAPIEAEIRRRAVETFQNDDTSLGLAIQACMILCECPDLDAATRSTVLTALQRRLEKACQNDDEFTRFVTTPGSFLNTSTPQIAVYSSLGSNLLCNHDEYSVIIDEKNTEQSVVLQLLRLTQILSPSPQGELEPQLNLVLSRTESSLRELTAAQRTSHPLSQGIRFDGVVLGPQVLLAWPGLSILNASSTEHDRVDGQRVTFEGPAVRHVVAKIWGDREPTRSDWLNYMVLVHPMMQDTVDRAIRTSLQDASISESHEPVVTPQDPSAVARVVPLYEGQPLEHWLDMLSREKSATGLASAFGACRAMLSPENGEQIAEAMWKSLPAIDGNISLGSGSEAGRIDVEAPRMLQRALAGPAYANRWLNEISTTDPAWKQRLWRYYGPYIDTWSNESVDLFVAWADQRLRQDCISGQPIEPDVIEAAERLRLFTARFYEGADGPLADRVNGILVASPQLDDSWWLNHAVKDELNGQRRSLWSAPIEAETIRRAVLAFQREDTATPLAIQACMILSGYPELDADSRSMVLAALRRRLAAACQNDEEFNRFVQTPDAFSHEVSALIDDESPLRTASITFEFRQSMAGSVPMLDHSVILHLLRLANALKEPGTLEPELKAVLSRTQETLRVVHARVGHREPSDVRREAALQAINRIQITLLWPDLTVSGGIGIGSRFGARAIDSDELDSVRRWVQRIWGSHEPTREDWIKFLVLLHPVMRDTVKQAIADLDAVPQSDKP